MNTLQRSMAKPPVHAFSALALVLADWAATGLNILTGMYAYWPVSIGAAIAAALATFFAERRFSNASQRAIMLKAGAAIPLIVVPLPLLGTTVGVAMLVWALVSRLVGRGASA
jgi:hypothetical protein